MGNRQSVRIEGRHHATRLLLDLGDELREARLRSGLTQGALATVLGTTRRRISMVERGQLARVPLRDVARHGGAVGLKLSARFFPAGPPVRDVAQVALLDRLRRRLPPSLRVRLEAPIPGDRDRRAWDMLLWDETTSIGVEAITRLRDVQAQVRAAQLKREDSGVQRLVLLIAATHANRRALRGAAPLLESTFTVGTRDAMAALVAGRDLGGDALVLL